MKDLIYKIIQLIGLFEYLIFIEKFSAYTDVMKSYKVLLIEIDKINSVDQITEETFISIKNAFRIMIEAPTKDEKIGTYILNKMQEIYLIQTKILQSK